MRIGIIGYLANIVEEKIGREFPILVDILILFADFAIYLAAFRALQGLM